VKLHVRTDRQGALCKKVSNVCWRIRSRILPCRIYRSTAIGNV